MSTCTHGRSPNYALEISKDFWSCFIIFGSGVKTAQNWVKTHPDNHIVRNTPQ